MPHNFRLQPLRNHFNKEPLTSDAARLIDVPGDEFLDTEEELNVIGACLWMICVEYDRLGEEKMPKKREELRKVRFLSPTTCNFVRGMVSQLYKRGTWKSEHNQG